MRTGVKTERLYPTSRLVSQVTGLHVQRNKAIVGQNAFAHEAGIHQHGMLTHRETYEIMRPEEVGFAKSQLVLGKHSGRHALKERLVALGYPLDDAAIDKVFQDFKVLADKKKDIYDADIEALVVHGQILGAGRPRLGARRALDHLRHRARCRSPRSRSAPRDGEQHRDVATGDGPVDAVYRAIEKITGIHGEAPRLPDRERLDRRGRAGRGVHRGRAPDRRLPRPRALHRHRRGQRARVPRRREPHRAQGPPRPSEARARRWGPPDEATEACRRARCSRRSGTPTSSGPRRRRRPAVLYVDLHLMHEVTSPQAFTLLRERGLKVRRPDRTLATTDHSTPTLPRLPDGRWPFFDAQNEAQVAQIERNAKDFGIELHGLGDPQQGVVHVFGPEMGATQPGMTVVCGDSHTATHGAFGALAFGIGTSEVGHVLATQCLLAAQAALARHPRGRACCQPGVTAKDLILAIIAQIGVGGGTGHVMEFVGPGGPRALDGGAHDPLQHGDRGRRARRVGRARRHHVPVARRASRARRRAPRGTRRSRGGGSSRPTTARGTTAR